ncbi:DUF6233 domain-containing protein [Streptomyces sp. NPDC001137]|uniref:DUF6233 domain-containing protein n=1 Tax=Streptomyces sp. NPDC001137 TaxID=3154378 RepID=UPI0033167345
MGAGDARARRSAGWVLQRLDGRRGLDRSVLHAPGCDQASVLRLEGGLDAAEKAGVRLCTLCGAAQELEPLLNGFDRGFGLEALDQPARTAGPVRKARRAQARWRGVEACGFRWCS